MTDPSLSAFLLAHWWLCLIAVFAFIWVVKIEMQRGFTKGFAITPQALTRKMNDESVCIVDIRSEANYNKGHILSAHHIPAQAVNIEHEVIKKAINRYIVIVCNLGQSAVAVANALRKAGAVNVLVLTGGMHAWEKANLPVVKEKKS